MRDSLYAEYSPTALAAVINHFREHCFDDSLAKVRDRSLPPNTWRRGVGYVVKHGQTDGRDKHKFCKTLDDVHTFINEQEALDAMPSGSSVWSGDVETAVVASVVDDPVAAGVHASESSGEGGG